MYNFSSDCYDITIFIVVVIIVVVYNSIAELVSSGYHYRRG